MTLVHVILLSLAKEWSCVLVSITKLRENFDNLSILLYNTRISKLCSQKWKNNIIDEIYGKHILSTKMLYFRLFTRRINKSLSPYLRESWRFPPNSVFRFPSCLSLLFLTPTPKIRKDTIVYHHPDSEFLEILTYIPGDLFPLKLL